MQHYINRPYVRRRRALSRLMMYAGIGSAVAGLVISLALPTYIYYALLAGIAGGLVAQIGGAFFGRFGTTPRIDQVLDASLKGLDDRYAVFHYLLGCDHALITPAGLFAVIPRLEDGRIRFEHAQWTQEAPRGGLLRRGPRLRRLRGLDREAERAARFLARAVRKHLPDARELDVEPLLVFLRENAHVESEGSPLHAIHVKKLKSRLRQMKKGSALHPDAIRALAEELGQ